MFLPRTQSKKTPGGLGRNGKAESRRATKAAQLPHSSTVEHRRQLLLLAGAKNLPRGCGPLVDLCSISVAKEPCFRVFKIHWVARGRLGMHGSRHETSTGWGARRETRLIPRHLSSALQMLLTVPCLARPLAA